MRFWNQLSLVLIAATLKLKPRLRMLASSFMSVNSAAFSLNRKPGIAVCFVPMVRLNARLFSKNKLVAPVKDRDIDGYAI
jgi:hypothetical protein